MDTDHDHHEGTPAAAATYAVRVLLEREPVLAAERLLESVRRTLPEATLVEPAPGVVTLAFGESSRITLRAAAADPRELDEAASQTWDWPYAREVAAKATAAIVIEDRGAAALERIERVRRVHATVNAVVETEPALALHWVASQRLVSPGGYRESLAHGAPVGDSIVNVRLFRIPDGVPGEHVMDTLGLAALGLRDLQVHFSGLDPNGVASVLYAYAEYLFEKGDVLDDFSLVRGLESSDEWDCRRAPALVPPEREAIELVPGSHAVRRR